LTSAPQPYIECQEGYSAKELKSRASWLEEEDQVDQ
jgi:hypothetical protein